MVEIGVRASAFWFGGWGAAAETAGEDDDNEDEEDDDGDAGPDPSHVDQVPAGALRAIGAGLAVTSEKNMQCRCLFPALSRRTDRAFYTTAGTIATRFLGHRNDQLILGNTYTWPIISTVQHVRATTQPVALRRLAN